jgi:hypothetical protein
MVRRIALLFALVNLCIFAPQSIAQQLITFDEIQPTNQLTAIPHGYAGLRWTNFSSSTPIKCPPHPISDVA